MRMRDWRTTGYAVLLSILWASLGLCAGLIVRALSPPPGCGDMAMADFLLHEHVLIGACAVPPKS
jgi:hypothetical protein